MAPILTQRLQDKDYVSFSENTFERTRLPQGLEEDALGYVKNLKEAFKKIYISKGRKAYTQLHYNFSKANTLRKLEA